jgi:alpha-ketoglutarate-dependent taurine dioxygenase
MSILVRELSAFYRAFAMGEPSPLSPLPVQYADFARWQRKYLEGETLQSHLHYWKSQIGGQTSLKLPFDRPRPPVQSYHGALHEIAVPPEVSDGIKALCRREGVTSFMLLLAAFQVTLHYYSGQDQFLIGTDVANRNHIETEDLIGFLVNQLVMRADLSGDPNFRETLIRVRECALGAYAHQDLPFEKLVEALNPERSLAAPPLFQVKLVLQNAPSGRFDLPGLSVKPLKIGEVSAKHDLTALLWEGSSGINGAFEYSLDLFDLETIRRIGDDFVFALQTLVNRPGMRLSEVTAMLSGRGQERKTAESQNRFRSDLARLLSIKPKAVSVAETAQVTMSNLRPDNLLPLVVKPVSRPPLREVDPVGWARDNRSKIEELLRKHGAILFRGFHAVSADTFEQFASALCADLFNENGEHLRENVSGNIYTPVFYPPDQKLLWHNENSFNHWWPSKIWFCCQLSPPTGGETPIVDSRKVFEMLPPAIRGEFQAKQVMYVRHYGEGFGLSWQTVFRTSDKGQLEEYCRQHQIDYEWGEDDTFITRAVRPAVVRHPHTGELCWFNQAQHWHPACLDPVTRTSIFSVFKEDRLPRNCYFGDGSSIPDAAMEAICKVYQQLEISFPWQRSDILLLDNLLTAHGRNPFTGERKLLVAMGAMTSFDQVSKN